MLLLSLMWKEIVLLLALQDCLVLLTLIILKYVETCIHNSLPAQNELVETDCYLFKDHICILLLIHFHTYQQIEKNNQLKLGHDLY